VIATSALMALEAWGHRQIESGRPFSDVLDDVLGRDGSSLGFVCVAIDLALSHWKAASASVWPLVATPEILQFDDIRMTRDVAGVDRLVSFESEPESWMIKRADLGARPSRRARLSDTIFHYVFRAPAEQLAALRTALEQARNEMSQTPVDQREEPINGIRATAERALRMTDAQHWPLKKVKLENGDEVEVRQFERTEEELKQLGAETTRIQADMRHHNGRAKVQSALFNPAESTAEIVAEGIAWTKEQANKPRQPDKRHDDDDSGDFSQEWDRRVVVMAAALVVRDYEGTDEVETLAWALEILNVAATDKAKEYHGNDQIEYNATAIAALGLGLYFLRVPSKATCDKLLRLASNQHPAVIRAIGQHLPEFAKIEPKLPRSFVRIIMTTAVRPRRIYPERHDEGLGLAYGAKVEAAVAAELRWLKGGDPEPPWPALPAHRSRPRHGIRIERWRDDDDDELDQPISDEYVDEHALGALVGHLIRLTIGDLPRWLLDLSDHLMRWTDQANGPHGESDRDRDNRPTTWNAHFFDFAGILSVALPHAELMATFVVPITKFRDEAFHDAMAMFLRGFDRATVAIDTQKPKDPAGVRQAFAVRIQSGWNYNRLGREKSFTSESHAADALTAMFYQPSRFANEGKSHIPDNWDGLRATIETLTNLVVGAGTSGYIATLFLNLIERSASTAYLPYVVRATSAWCSGYGPDTNFWTEKEMGSRVCNWLERVLPSDSSIGGALEYVRDELLKCLDVLVRAGVAHARVIEEKILRSPTSR
jgi:hypothetical protein